MAYYADLTHYNYHHYCEKELNVGWLQKDQPFPIGEVSTEFLEKLKWFNEKPFPLFYLGHHQCEFCEDIEATSSCELRIVGSDGTVYATPSLIIHYIEKHNYLPPQQFIDAVLNGPRPGQDMYTDIIYKLTPPLWETRRPDPNDDDYEENIKKIMIDKISSEVDSKILDELLNTDDNLKKFIENYNQVMPSVYGMKNKKKKS